MKKRIAILCLALAFAVPAFAMKYFLQSQWYDHGDHFCRYSNGTVLNMGYRICPLSIEGN